MANVREAKKTTIGPKRIPAGTDALSALVRKAATEGDPALVRSIEKHALSVRSPGGRKRTRRASEAVLTAGEAIFFAALGVVDERDVHGLKAEDALGFARVGLGFLAQNKDDAAYAAGQLCSALDDKCAEGWFVRAASAARLGKEAEAIGAYQKVLELAPSHLPAAVDLAELHIRRLQYAEAAKRLDYVLKADPKAETPAGKRAQVLVVSTLMQLEGT